MFNKFYYAVKPFVPLALRRSVRRHVARRTRRKAANIWPISLGSEEPPADWPGWPEGKKFAFVLTHDVEGQSGVDKSLQLMATEMEHGFRSSFNFIPEGGYDAALELRQELVRNGFEIGVHDLRHDGKLYGSRKDFAINAARINDYLKKWGAVGFRAGFMFHNLEWLQDLDIAYDASTFDVDPFEPQPDGVNTIFPFWRSGVSGRGYVELPYTLPQDSTLFLLFGETRPDIWLRKLDWVAANGGMALVNVHPDYLQFDGKPIKGRTFPVDFYEQLLEHVRKKYGDTCWHVLPKELAAWFVKNRTAPLAQGSPERPTELKRRSRRALAGRAAVVLFSHYLSDPRPRRETEALAAAGMEADVICLRDADSPLRSERVNGVNIHYVGMGRKRGKLFTYLLQYGMFFMAAFWRLTVWSLRGRYNLVHVHNMPDFLAFSALVPRLRGAKVILDLHDPMPELFCGIFRAGDKSFGYRALCRVEKWSIGFSHLVLTPNLAFKELFGQRNRAGEKIHIIMNSPDESLFNPSNHAVTPSAGSAKQFRVMYHGLLVERHGLDLVLEAMPRFAGRCPNLVVDIYGQHTAYVDRILEQIRRLKLEGVARYHGFKSLEEIVRIISEIDLGVVPNRLNDFTAINFPTRIFEYLAMGKPVLAPRTKGIADYFAEDQILYFEPGNLDDLAEKIAWAYSHPAELKGVVARGREVYLRHAWSRQRIEFLNLVHDLLALVQPDTGDAGGSKNGVAHGAPRPQPMVSAIKEH